MGGKEGGGRWEGGKEEDGQKPEAVREGEKREKKNSSEGGPVIAGWEGATESLLSGGEVPWIALIDR